LQGKILPSKTHPWKLKEAALMKTRSLFLLLSGCIHAGLLLTLSVPMRRLPPAAPDETKTLSLVNITVQEEPAPLLAPTSPEPAAPPPAPPPLEPTAPPRSPPPDSDLAEQYFEEESPDEPEPAAGNTEDTGQTTEPAAEVPAASHENAAPRGNAGPATGNAALVADYARRNYTYIQRRIRDRLVYPAPARRAGIQGVTELAFTIHEDGRVSAITIQKSSGHSVLDEAAVETVLAAAPFPRPPAPARLAIPISFRLR
jgi:protein TonB